MGYLLFYGVFTPAYNDTSADTDLLTSVRKSFFEGGTDLRNKIQKSVDGETFVCKYAMEKGKPLKWKISTTKLTLENSVKNDDGSYVVKKYDTLGNTFKECFFSPKHTLLKVNYYNIAICNEPVCVLESRIDKDEIVFLQKVLGLKKKIVLRCFPAIDNKKVADVVYGTKFDYTFSALSNRGIVYFGTDEQIEKFNAIVDVAFDNVYTAISSESENSTDTNEEIQERNERDAFDFTDDDFAFADSEPDFSIADAKPLDDSYIESIFGEIREAVLEVESKNRPIEEKPQPKKEEVAKPADEIDEDDDFDEIDEAYEAEIIGEEDLDEDLDEDENDVITQESLEEPSQKPIEIKNDENDEFEVESIFEELDSFEKAEKKDEAPATQAQVVALPNAQEFSVVVDDTPKNRDENKTSSNHSSGEFDFNFDTVDEFLLKPKANANMVIAENSDRYYYFGDIENNRRSGKGRMELENGSTIYDGQYRNNMRNGFGCYYLKNGNICYVGEWENNMCSGVGVGYNSSDKSIHLGNWSENSPKGAGARFSKDGELLYVTNESENSSSYKVSFLDNSTLLATKYDKEKNQVISVKINLDDLIK